MSALCSIKNGKSDTQDATDRGPYAFFDRSKAIKRSDRFLFDCEALIIPGEGTEFLPRQFNGKFDLHQRAYALHNFSETINPRFLFHFLVYKKDYFPRVAVGTTVKSLRMRHFEDLPVSVTTLGDQQRIVAILDEALAGIAVAEASVKRNLKNTYDAFESFRDDIFNAKSHRSAKSLGEIASFRNGVNFTKSSKGRVVKIVGVKDFQNRFAVPTEGLEAVTINGEVNKDDLLRGNDLLTVRSNGNIQLIGRTMVVDECPANTIHSGFTIRTRLTVDSVFSQYLCHFMRSRGTRRRMIDGGTGTNIKSLNQGTLTKLLVPLPSHDEQKRIAKRLDGFAQRTDRLTDVYKQKLVALERLKQSLLSQAFSGNL